jgi:N-ethylmaleimide reductase
MKAMCQLMIYMVCIEQRASAGLIITEGAQVSLDAIGYINTAGIHTDESRRLEKKPNVCMIKAGKSLFNCGM